MAPTPPTLPNGQPFKERILLYGPPKAGKSHLSLTIARALHGLGSDGVLYGLSTDMSFEAIMMGESFYSLPNVMWWDISTLQDFIDRGRELLGKVRPQDWVVSDLQSDAWAFAQDEYAQAQAKAAGSTGIADMGDLWKTRAGTDYPIAGWDWGMPNARYRIFTNNIIMRMPCHVIMVERETDLVASSGSGKTNEDPRVKQMFGHVGMKPAGQKEDPFRFHSIIRVEPGTIEDGLPKTNLLTTAGDRVGGRRMLGRRMRNGMARGEEVEDFFYDYLVKVGGWTI